MQTETIDRLFLELSQVTGATTAKEFELQREVRWLRKAFEMAADNGAVSFH